MKNRKIKFCEHEFEYINILSDYSENFKKEKIMICIKCGKNKKESRNNNEF